MEENKDLINNSAEEAEVTEEVIAAEETAADEIEVAAEEISDEKPNKKNFFKFKKSDKLKNEASFKRGGMALAVTAILLAGLIILNVLLAALAKRVSLSFDMTTQKVNTISEDNIDFIKGVEDEVEITVFATEDNFVSYISYYCENYYQATPNNDYFEQTLSLISKYEDYNSKINLSFVDPQSTEFTAFSSKYSSMTFIPGDIFVKATMGGVERHKQIGFNDIYELAQDSTYSAYGYSYYNITGNNIETALTSAIAYVTSSETKKAGIITGHSAKNYTSKYVEILEDNNYEVELISDEIIREISSELDIIVLMAPSIDFTGEELDVISNFLDNEGNLGKGFMFFGDSSYPALPNLSEFLVEWGIEVTDGMLFETDSENRSAADPCTMYLYPISNSITSDMTACITGYNIPMVSVEPADDTISVTEHIMTSETVVKAPLGVTSDWSDYSDDDKGQFGGVLESVKRGELDSATGESKTSYIMAFSSVEYIQSEWAEYNQLSNKDITLKCTELAAHVSEQPITFVSKTITNDSFTDAVTLGSTRAIRFIFMIFIPIAMVAVGIYIYIRRRNA